MYVQPSEKKQWYRLGNLPVSWRVAYPDSHGQVSWGAMCVVGVGWKQACSGDLLACLYMKSDSSVQVPARRRPVLQDIL